MIYLFIRPEEQSKKLNMLWICISTIKSLNIPYCQNIAPHGEMCHNMCDSLMGWSTLPGRYRWASLNLCPPCMTVDGKTYGGAGRGAACVRWEEVSGKRRTNAASPGVTLVAGWNPRGNAVGDSGEGRGSAVPGTEGGEHCQSDLHTSTPRDKCCTSWE